MIELATSVSGIPRRRLAPLALVFAMVLSGLLPSRLVGADPSPAPESVASPAPTLAPVEAMCGSATDLRLIIEFLRNTDVEADGWVPVLVGTIAALSEARQLAGSLGDTYRPLLDDLIGSLEGLRSTIDELSEMETMGQQVAVIGESITDIGIAMDALSIQLQTPCPTGAPESAETPAG